MNLDGDRGKAMKDEPNEQPLDAVGDGDGRGPGGRFAKGNKAGRGNPHAQKAQQLRAAVMRALTAGELRAVVKKLVAQALDGDVTAAREVLLRALGPPVPWDLEERLSRIEATLEEAEADGHGD